MRRSFRNWMRVQGDKMVEEGIPEQALEMAFIAGRNSVLKAIVERRVTALDATKAAHEIANDPEDGSSGSQHDEGNGKPHP